METLTDIEQVLQTYELTEIFELNDLSEEDVLTYLVEQGFILLPDPRPI